MTTATAAGIGARPNIYALLDQRVSRHGKSLYDTVKGLAPEITPAPSSPEELQACVWNVFGLWSPDPARKQSAQGPLAVEHLALMEEIAVSLGQDMAAGLEAKLQQMIGNQLGRLLQVELKVPNDKTLIPLREVTSVNAYTAFAQRTALLRFQPHEAVNQWVSANSGKQVAVPDTGVQRLAQEFCGLTSPAPAEPTRFQRAFACFMTGVGNAASPDRAAVVQSSLLAAISRLLRRAIKEQQGPVEPVSAVPQP